MPSLPRMLLMTERSEVERVLEYVVQANTAQMADAAFIKELETWIRFNGAEAVRTADGLYSAASGKDKYVRQIRSSAGIAVLAGQAADESHWVEVGRCYECFALQATALGIRNALLNQPIEVQAVRCISAACRRCCTRASEHGLRPQVGEKLVTADVKFGGDNPHQAPAISPFIRPNSSREFFPIDLAARVALIE